MAYRVRLLVTSSIFLSFLALLLPGQSLAAGQGLSLTTSPVSLNLNVKPGTSSTSTVQLMNNGVTPLTIQMELKQFAAVGDTGEATITNIPADNPAASWVNISPSSFVAQPGVWNSVKVTIKLPVYASLGYYYAVIFQPQVTIGTPHESTSIKGSNAILVLVDTGSSNESRDVQVANFSASHGVYEYLPATFNVTIHNSGNIYLAPTGDVFISRHANMTDSMATLPVNSGGGNILPDSDRSFQASWTDGFPLFKPKTVDSQPVTNSKGQDVMHLTWNFSQANKFRFGKYYAEVVLAYNNGKYTVPITGELSFWVIPWKLMIGLLVLLCIVGFGLWSVGRGIVRRIRKVPVKRISVPGRHKP